MFFILLKKKKEVHNNLFFEIFKLNKKKLIIKIIK